MFEGCIQLRPVLVVLVALLPLGAAAQPTQPRDAIHLRNGGVLHGTIAEELPDHGFVMVLVTGETRRVEASEVESAGPEASAASRPSTERAPFRRSPLVAIRFESGAPEATLHRVTGRAVATSTVRVAGHYGVGVTTATSLEPVCTAPCSFRAPMGTHELALSVPGRLPVIADPIALRHGGVLRGSYHSRADVRRLGWTLFIAGEAIGLGMLYAGFDTAEHDGGLSESRRGRSLAFGALALLVLSPLVALPFVLQRDSAEFHLDAR